MSTPGGYILRLLTFCCLYLIWVPASAQDDTIPKSRQISTDIDTSEYIPIFYEGALNYNLMIASSKGYSSEIDRLIGLGADVNSETDEGVTPLIFAVMANQLDAVKTIIKYNPDLNKLTSSYETPLIIAVKNDNFDITETLIRAGADVDVTDRNGATPLHYASILGYFKIADLLLYYDADVDQKSDDDISPLLASVMAGYADVADLLIQHGANMETRDNQGFTPFLMAALKGDTLIMALLHKFGVDIYAVNNDHYTALDIAIAYDQAATVKYLLSIGDKWLEAPDNAVSPYDVAAKYGRKEAIMVLKEHNLPGNIRYGIDQVAISISSRFTFKDIYSGISMSFREPYLNAGLTIGFDTKFWYNRVLIKDSEHLYYQYLNKANMAYAGLFKDFILYDKANKYNVSLSVSALGGYSFGQILKGTANVPGNKFHVIPDISLRYNKTRFSCSLGLEYINSQYYRNGPVWFRAGFSWTFFFDNTRSYIKPLKWR